MSKNIFRRKSLSITFFATIAVALPNWAFGWGEPGHRLINRAAAQLMKSSVAGFFQANSDNLAVLATTPDLKWKQKATYEEEKGLHFFQWDNYSQSSIANSFPIGLNDAIQSVGKKFINVNGASVWRSAQIYKLMVQALSKGDCATALQMGGVLGHYIGDLSQPMHDSSDYDGQSIGKHGIHAYFETTLVAKQNQAQLLTTVEQDGREAHPEVEPSQWVGNDRDIVEMTALEAQVSVAELPVLLSDFQASPENDADLTAHLGPLMGRGAYTLARVWDLASDRAAALSSQKSIACPAQAISVSEPAWFALSE